MILPGSPRWTRRRLAAMAVALLLLGAPFVLAPYQVFQLTMITGYAVALLGLNILMGFNGQISLGHGAFYALGAYASGILIDHFKVPYWATIPAAGGLGLCAGFLFGLPAVKLEGLYLALATFGLAVSVPQLLKYRAFDDWTGGFQGITITKPDAPFRLPLTQDQWLYFFSLAVAAAMFVLASNLLQGRMGRAMVAVRDQPIAARAMGVDTTMLKSMTFGVSAMYTAVAGALATVTVQYVSPDSFSMFLSITFLVGVVVGGLATLSGAIFGAFVIGVVPNIADSISKSAPWAVYGSFLIISVFLMPGGCAGMLRRVFHERATQAEKNVPATLS